MFRRPLYAWIVGPQLIHLSKADVAVLMSILGSLSFALRVLVELLRWRERRRRTLRRAPPGRKPANRSE